MCRFWIIEQGNIIQIVNLDTENKNQKEQKIEIHKAIIQALKEAKEK